MRKLLIIALCLAAGAAMAGEEGAWMSMENCAMHEHLVAEPGLVDHMTYEVYVTQHGMMTVTTVSEDYSDEYMSAMKHMQETGAKLMGGEKLELCGYCQSHMAIMGGGKATMEPFHTAGGDVMIVSSTDEATVAQIHEHAKHAQMELKKMAEGKESR